MPYTPGIIDEVLRLCDSGAGCGMRKPHLTVGKIDLDPAETAQRIHAKQQSRSILEIEMAEWLDIGEGDRRLPNMMPSMRIPGTMV